MTRRLRIAAVAIAAAALGAACQADEQAGEAPAETAPAETAAEGGGHTHAPGEGHPPPIGDGSTASAGGYRLADVRLDARPGRPGEVSFRVLDRRGRPVEDYLYEQTKLLHLYVVRTDLTGFRHLHPTLAADDTWTARLHLAEPGDYRVLAEFVPEGTGGRAVALGAVRTVPGRWRPTTVPVGATAAEGDDGVVRVRVDGAGEVGPDGRLTLVVSRVDGEGPVPLETYLDTHAHLTGFPVDGGAGYVHVHPYGAPEEAEDGTRLSFHTTFDEPGDYRFFVQVRAGGFVHTVPVTAAVR